jgi:hypothetical protein
MVNFIVALGKYEQVVQIDHTNKSNHWTSEERKSIIESKSNHQSGLN